MTAAKVPAGGGLPHVETLDGIRGLALAMVLVYHAGPSSWAPGGFVGMPVFFALSGYLIGSLVVAEVDENGALSLATFWVRRARRLLPALLVMVVGVVVISWFVVLPSSTRGELLGGLGYVANWVQMGSGREYADLFRNPSAATHLWSLSIEEQFYLLLPLTVWWGLRRSTRNANSQMAPGSVLRRWYIWGGLAVIVAGMISARLVDDTAYRYYATSARVPEIAAGIVLAGLWPIRAAFQWWDSQQRRWPVVAANVVGFSALVALVGVSAWSQLSDPWVQGGGLVVASLLASVLMVACLAPGPLASLVSFRPMSALGRVSYGVYLYHWPIVVVMSPPRVTLEPVALFVARMVVTLAVSAASAVLIEQPIRQRRVAWVRSDRAVLRTGLGSMALMVVVVIVGVAVPDGAGTPRRDAPAVVVPQGPDRTPRTDPSTPAVPVVAMFGDSFVNWMLRDGGWSLDPTQISVVDGSLEGCDGAEGAPIGRAGNGVVVSVPESCEGWRSQYRPVFDSYDVDIAVLVVGTGAVLDRELDGEFEGPCGEAAARWYRDDLVQRLEYLSEQADEVAIVYPAWSEDWSGWVNPSDHQARTDCVRATMRAAVADSGLAVHEVDLVDLLCPDGKDACRPLRETDGVHLDPDSAPEVLQWLTDDLVELASGG